MMISTKNTENSPKAIVVLYSHRSNREVLISKSALWNLQVTAPTLKELTPEVVCVSWGCTGM